MQSRLQRRVDGVEMQAPKMMRMGEEEGESESKSESEELRRMSTDSHE